MEGFSFEDGVVDIDINILSHLEEELAWTADKQLWIISTIMLFVTGFEKPASYTQR